MTLVEAVPQHLSALERANQVRCERARVKREVRAGALSVPDALGLECCETMLLAELLRSQRQWGPGRASRFLRGAGLGERKLIGTLTDRQRDLVRELLA